MHPCTRVQGTIYSCSASLLLDQLSGRALLCGRWERCETAAQEADGPADDDTAADEGAAASAAWTSEEAKASGRQIFSSREAYAMLSNERLDIFQQRSSISVSAVDDSVYHWDVKLSDFASSSPLAQVWTPVNADAGACR